MLYLNKSKTQEKMETGKERVTGHKYMVRGQYRIEYCVWDDGFIDLVNLHLNQITAIDGIISESMTGQILWPRKLNQVMWRVFLPNQRTETITGFVDALALDLPQIPEERLCIAYLRRIGKEIKKKYGR